MFIDFLVLNSAKNESTCCLVVNINTNSTQANDSTLKMDFKLYLHVSSKRSIASNIANLSVYC